MSKTVIHTPDLRHPSLGLEKTVTDDQEMIYPFDFQHKNIFDMEDFRKQEIIRYNFMMFRVLWILSKVNRLTFSVFRA
jgi:hypothetical protein